MSLDYDHHEGGEFAAAMAAAAFAIHSMEEESSEYHKKKRDSIETSRITVKSRKEEFGPPESGRVSRRFPDAEAKGPDTSRGSHPFSAGRLAGEQSQKWNTSSTRRRSFEVKADAWEKSAMAKIKQRYKKLNAAILAWEKEKKVIVKQKMDKKKRELELIRELNLRHYQNKLARIDHIVAGERAQMEEKRKNQESEVKVRAKRIRSTGKRPLSCFCF